MRASASHLFNLKLLLICGSILTAHFYYLTARLLASPTGDNYTTGLKMRAANAKYTIPGQTKPRIPSAVIKEQVVMLWCAGCFQLRENRTSEITGMLGVLLALMYSTIIVPKSTARSMLLHCLVGFVFFSKIERRLARTPTRLEQNEILH